MTNKLEPTIFLERNIMHEIYKLYCYPMSPFSYLAHATMEYKNLTFENIIVNILKGEQRNEEFMKISPYGQIPCIQNSEITLYDSWAIFEYLEEKYTQSPMLPKEEPNRSKVRAVAMSISTTLVPITVKLFLDRVQKVPLSDERKVQIIINLREKLKVLCKELEQIKQIYEFSPVEPLFFQTWMNITYLLPQLKSEYPKLQAYYEEVSELPVIQSIEESPEIIEARKFIEKTINLSSKTQV